MATKEVAKKKAAAKAPAPAERALSPLVELRHRMDNLFDDFARGWHMPAFRPGFWHGDPYSEHLLSSKLGGDLVDAKFDVSEDENAIEITAELPGMDEKDVELSVAGGVLTVKGEKKAESEEKKKNYYRSERHFGSFVRSFRLPDTVNEEKIKASFDKGVLEIMLPKRTEVKAKAKKIAISASSKK